MATDARRATGSEQSYQKAHEARIDDAPPVQRRAAAVADHRATIAQSHELRGEGHLAVQLRQSTEAAAGQSGELARTAGSLDGSADAAITLQFLYGDVGAVEAWFGQARGAVSAARGRAEGGDGAVREVALAGVEGAHESLPHRDRIQASFGAYDVSGLKASVGGEAGAAARAIGAEAYTAGDRIAFDGDPSLHTTAHEATHAVLQQRGIRPSGGVGAAGDPFEQHADAVADAVVRGEDAEPLLDAAPGASTAPSAHPAAASGPVQSKGSRTPGQAVQRKPTHPAEPAIQMQDPSGGAPGEPPGAPPSGPVDEDGNPREPTEEEIEQMILEARAQGESQGADVAAQPPPEAPPAPPTEGAVEQVPETPEMADDSGHGAGGVFAAVPPGPDSALPTWQSLKNGPLSKWDDEVAWHEYFQGDGPTAGAAIDRDALIADALSGGALGGFQAGLKNIAIDTAINIASSRIPYLQGFVEMARIAYDPAAWLEGTVQSTYGNVVQGGAMLWEGISSGDPIAALDGLLTVLEGINNVISTLSTLCWIVAAASFLLSFICPAAAPFAALAANWGLTLGTVSTAFGVFITLGRAIVIALRMLQIKYGEADPETLLQQGERLRAQTQAFTGEFTTRAGNRLRSTAQTRLQARGQTQGTTQSAPRTSSPRVQPQTRMQRVMGALDTGATMLTGGGSPRGAMGDAFGSRNADGSRSGGAVQRAVQGTQAWAGRGQYARPPGGGARSQRQQVADMEHAGLTVFASDAARTRFAEQTAGQQPGVNRELVERHQAATRTLREASDADLEAQRRLEQAEAEASEARRRLQAARDDEDLQQTIRETRAHHEANASRVAEARRAIEVQAHVIRVLEDRRARQAAEGVDPRLLSIADQHISQAQIELYDRRIALANAEYDAAVSNVARLQAIQPMHGAEAWDADKQDRLASARTDAAGTKARRTDAEQGVRDASHAFSTSDRIGGMTQQRSDEAGQRDATQRQQWYLDFTGTGPSDLHGHNKGSGVTGAGGAFVDTLQQQARAEASADPTDDGRNFMGVWDRTTDGQPLDPLGNAGARGPGEDYRGQLQQRYDALRTSLPAPPASAADTVDGAREAYAALDEEKRQVVFQQDVMRSLLEEADASMSALEAMEQISAANQEAIAAHEAQLGEKQSAQDALRSAGQETQNQAAEGEQSGSSTAETIGGFIGRFMEMLGVVPSRVIPNAGAGADGIQRVQTAAAEQGQTSADAHAAAGNAVVEADRMRQETAMAATEAQADQATLTTLDEQVAAERLSAVDGQTFLQDTLLDAETRQAELEAEMQRLRGEHEAAVQGGASWVSTHEATRVAGLGELDGIVELIEGGSDG